MAVARREADAQRRDVARAALAASAAARERDEARAATPAAVEAVAAPLRAQLETAQATLRALRRERNALAASHRAALAAPPPPDAVAARTEALARRARAALAQLVDDASDSDSDGSLGGASDAE